MRRRGPGLVGTMARTAVVAGTATATVGAVSGRQQKKAAAGQQQAAAQQQQIYEQGVADAQAQAAQAAAAQAAAAAAPPVDDVTAEITRLGELHAKGLLSDEEFSAAKAKALGI